MLFFVLFFCKVHLPVSYRSYACGAKWIRYWTCKGMLARCGKNVNIEHGADIATGRHIEIGDNSGIGINCVVKRAIIGENMMMGPDVVFINRNHRFDDLDKPLQEQGYVTPPH